MLIEIKNDSIENEYLLDLMNRICGENRGANKFFLTWDVRDSMLSSPEAQAWIAKRKKELADV